MVEEYKHTEVGLIPSDWEVITLGEITTIIRGASPRPKGDKRFYGGNIPRLMVEDVTRDGKYVTPSVDFLTELGAKQSRPCSKGTLTIVCSGSPGVPSILNVDACIHDGFIGLTKILSKYSTEYLFYILTSLKQKFNSTAVDGGVFINLTTSTLKEFKIVVPPTKAEQTAIATALNDADALIQKLEQLIAKKRNIKTGAMQELLKPKKGWEVKKLGEVVNKFVNGGTPSTTIAKYWLGHIPWVSGADVLNQKIGQIRRYITVEAVKNSSTNVIEKGNLLFVSRTGVGKLAIAPFDIAISQDFTGIYLNASILIPEFLYRYFDSILEELQNQNQGTSIKGVTRESLFNFLIPIPPLETQTHITQILSDMDNEIQELEKQLEKYKMMKRGMMQSLLTGKIRLV